MQGPDVHVTMFLDATGIITSTDTRLLHFHAHISNVGETAAVGCLLDTSKRPHPRPNLVVPKTTTATTQHVELSEHISAATTDNESLFYKFDGWMTKPMLQICLKLDSTYFLGCPFESLSEHVLTASNLSSEILRSIMFTAVLKSESPHSSMDEVKLWVLLWPLL